MCWRRWVGIVAVVGLLLHAAAVVRHHALMLANSLDPAVAALSTDLEQICHFNGDATERGHDKRPSASGNCPICTGIAAAFALPPPAEWQQREPIVVVERYQIRPDQRVDQLKRIRPPGRGPPEVI